MNIYKILIPIVGALITIATCTKPSKLTLYVVFDSVKNLKEGSEVYFNNVAVGKVDNLELLPDYRVLVKVTVEKSFKPAREDTFALVKYDFLGTQVVQVVKGKAGDNQFYANGDTIKGMILKKGPILQLDSATRRIARDSLITPYIRKQ
jgi:ABC-type transporter Mla subunit MlaD